MMGLYGPIFFQSSSTNLSTFDEMKKTVTARWETHEVHMMKPLLEYSGPQLIEISFKMELIKPFTIDPLGAIVTLQEVMDLAVPLPLIVGLFPMGRGMSLFVLTNLQHEMKYFYRGGALMGASVEVQLKEYPDNLLQTLLSALGGAFNGSNATPTDANAGPLSTSNYGTENQGFEASEYNSTTNQGFEATEYPAATNPTIPQNQSFEASEYPPAAPTTPASAENLNQNIEGSSTGGEF